MLLLPPLLTLLLPLPMLPIAFQAYCNSKSPSANLWSKLPLVIVEAVIVELGHRSQEAPRSQPPRLRAPVCGTEIITSESHYH